jgi:c-di-AMP phosphodiesterase-like protein
MLKMNKKKKKNPYTKLIIIFTIIGVIGIVLYFYFNLIVTVVQATLLGLVNGFFGGGQ